MIELTNGSIVRLGAVDPAEVVDGVHDLLVPGEQVLRAFKGIRDFVVFTDKRLVVVDVQGLTGRKRDFTSLPYSRVQAFSVETAGTLDLDAELDLWFSGLGNVRLEFRPQVDVRELARLIAARVL
ncbi:PH domain-containing protein [Quadrisphaera sp. INWT6]|uniref:PH domain-containing protein n=1 Tax=Quadrisphaera sp. INWT6 TaxID=2596917 RepID=UPI0018924425|nr:PH domain-containing protein [Quadrisphaera sp. INWT6]MBF5083200.1 PH domain-containing protein [Quadrisphaera sp. INWT6]